jgi:lipoprotein-releasing system permease protein
VKLESFIAFRYLRTSKKESFVSVVSTLSFLGMMLGVATLIIVMAVMSGFKHELQSRILGFNSHLTLFTSGKINPRDILSIQNIRSANFIMEKQGICTSRHRTSGAIIRCIPFQELKKKKIVSENIVCGAIGSDKDEGIVMGHKLAKNLGILCSDVISIMAAEGRPTPLGTLPRVQDFKVKALFDSGMHEYDSSVLFLPLGTGKEFFEEEPTSYEIFLHNLDDMDRTKRSLYLKGFHVTDWRNINSNLFKAIQVQSNVMFIILTLIVLVAAFNIMSGLIMLVKDKTKDIAILRTMGATRKSIILVFMMVGSYVGILGTLMGSLIGLLFSYNINTIRQFLESLSHKELFQSEIYFLSSLPARVELSKTFFVVGTALLLTLISTAYPAWKASKLHPAKGLHYE